VQWRVFPAQLRDQGDWARIPRLYIVAVISQQLLVCPQHELWVDKLMVFEY
jgi:hypothetical protein